MNSDRIKEIQETTAYPESVSVKQALLQVWNECEQEQTSDLQKRIKELEEERKWISVEDRLPEDFTSVLIYGQAIRASALFEKGNFHSDFNLPESKYVTHWMPLPEPPIK